MQPLSAAVHSLLANRVLRLATCWRIERTDAVVLRFTSHDHIVVIAGEQYRPLGSMSISAAQKEAGLTPRNADCIGILDSGAITEADLLARKYDGARIREYVVDWLYPWAGFFGQALYDIAEIRFDDAMWRATMHSPSGRLEGAYGRSASRDCDAIFGDSRCQANKVTYTVTGAVTAVVTQRKKFRTNRTEANGWFSQGELTWTSGANNGTTDEIRTYLNANGEMELSLFSGKNIAIGDTFSVVAGCDHTFATCVSKFNNSVHYQGFPFIPGNDEITRPQIV